MFLQCFTATEFSSECLVMGRDFSSAISPLDKIVLYIKVACRKAILLIIYLWKFELACNHQIFKFDNGLPHCIQYESLFSC